VDVSTGVIEQHRAAGRFFMANGVRSFVREEGDGEAVVCVHGVPASSFLYRKVLTQLAVHGLRGIAFDLPGLGLADRPRDFDYSWTGLGRFATATVEALGLHRFHLVVHDVGGPVGFELAAAAAPRVRSLTVLNTVVEPDTFSRPWTLAMFARHGMGEILLRTMPRPVFRALMHRLGIGDVHAITRPELDSYLDLLRRGDGGQACLRILRSFERTAVKRRLYEQVLRTNDYPVQVIWGRDDPVLPLAVHGERARRMVEPDRFFTVAAKHFLQEDQASTIAQHVASIASEDGEDH
jgi:pimeloyl-ACP methyl ester carboxylesterase